MLLFSLIWNIRVNHEKYAIILKTSLFLVNNNIINNKILGLEAKQRLDQLKDCKESHEYKVVLKILL